MIVRALILNSCLLHGERKQTGEGVGFTLVNVYWAGGIVVTQDYGVAAMALARGAYAINQDGWLWKTYYK
ncbi:MAG: DUF188 domain-containing protein [Anaerovibrio sp.]|nr:DUF188 domain-containing protein [Anaerovibrio sp.]